MHCVDHVHGQRGEDVGKHLKWHDVICRVYAHVVSRDSIIRIQKNRIRCVRSIDIRCDQG